MGTTNSNKLEKVEAEICQMNGRTRAIEERKVYLEQWTLRRDELTEEENKLWKDISSIKCVISGSRKGLDNAKRYLRKVQYEYNCAIEIHGIIYKETQQKLLKAKQVVEEETKKRDDQVISLKRELKRLCDKYNSVMKESGEHHKRKKEVVSIVLQEYDHEKLMELESERDMLIRLKT